MNILSSSWESQYELELSSKSHGLSHVHRKGGRNTQRSHLDKYGEVQCWINIGLAAAAAAAAKSLQSCLTLCDPRDSSPPDSPVPGILQARTLEWVAISFSNAWKWKVKSESEVTQSCLTLVTPWTAVYQAPPPMGFSRQEYWSGVPLPSPEDNKSK